MKDLLHRVGELSRREGLPNASQQQQPLRAYSSNKNTATKVLLRCHNVTPVGFCCDSSLGKKKPLHFDYSSPKYSQSSSLFCHPFKSRITSLSHAHTHTHTLLELASTVARSHLLVLLIGIQSSAEKSGAPSSVCVQQTQTERGSARGKKLGKSDYLSVVKLFQSRLSPPLSRDEAHAEAKGLADTADLFLFSSPHHVPSEREMGKKKKLFPPTCVWRLWSLSLPQTLCELPVFFSFFLYKGFWEPSAEVKPFFDFLVKISGADHFWGFLASSILSAEFLWAGEERTDGQRRLIKVLAVGQLVAQISDFVFSK